jgi:hypothetical protein
MGDMRNAYTILGGMLEGKRPFRRLGIIGVILKLILKRWI